jgi:hypothetical protein
LLLHIRKRSFEELHNLGIGIGLRVGAGQELSQHSDPRAHESILVQGSKVADGPPALGSRSHGVSRIGAGNNVENRHSVGDAPRDRTADIPVKLPWHDAITASQPHC